MKIDFIIPYVNCEDENGLSEFKKHGGILNDDIMGGKIRYKDEGTLRYLLRSIEVYTPGVNNVYLLVASESQIPEYINRSTIKIIYHKDFIPEEYLPVFNSNHIESFMGLLYKIPDLSENIVWGNDDVIINRPLDQSFFFSSNGNPMYDICFDKFYKGRPFDILRLKVSEFILNYKKVVRTKHGSISYKLSLLKDCYEKYDFVSTLGKIHSTKRLPCNVNQGAYALYQGIRVPVFQPNIKIGTGTDKKMPILNREGDQLTVNSGCLSDNNLKEVLDFLNTKFPNKSKYELNNSNTEQYTYNRQLQDKIQERKESDSYGS